MKISELIEILQRYADEDETLEVLVETENGVSEIRRVSLRFDSIRIRIHDNH